MAFRHESGRTLSAIKGFPVRSADQSDA
jgi:hypothetical protein